MPPDAVLFSYIRSGAGKAIGELEAFVGLNTLNLHAVTGKDRDNLLEEVGREISALLKVSAENMETVGLVDDGIMVEAKIMVRHIQQRGTTLTSIWMHWLG